MIRKWRAGSFSMGFLLIRLGILLILSQFTSVDAIKVILMVWPIVLICLGAEVMLILFMKKDDDSRIKYDGISILFIVIMLLTSMAVYAATSYISIFDTRDEFFEAYNIYPESHTFKGELKAGGADTVKLVSGGRYFNYDDHVFITQGGAGDIKVEYTARLRSNGMADLAALKADIIKIENDSGNALLFFDTDFNSYNAGVGYIRLSMTIYVPEGKTLDIRSFNGNYTIDPDAAERVLEKDAVSENDGTDLENSGNSDLPDPPGQVETY